MFGFGRKKNDKKEILFSVESLETRVAILEKGKLEDFKIEHPTEEHIVASIYKGVIQNLEDGLQAAFVDIGSKKNAFIHYWDMFPEDLSRLEAFEGTQAKGVSKRRQVSRQQVAKHFKQGSEIIVQVTKGPIGTKGPRVTANLSIPSRFFVLMPGSNLRGISKKIEDSKERKRLKKILTRLPVPEGCGIIIRTAGAGVRAVNFARDLRSLTDEWNIVKDGIENKPAPACLYREPDLVERIVRDSVTDDVDSLVIDSKEEYTRVKQILSRVSKRFKGKVKLYDGALPVFEHYKIDSQLDQAFRRKVMLPSGGYIVLDETEALLAVDVNTGQHKGANSQDETIFQVNLEAVEEVARQLRLRNLGGLVVVDLVDMRQRKHRNQVFQRMKDVLKRDKARTNVLPISPLGLLEMTRRRMDESIESSMFVDCPYCNGKGSIKSPLSMRVEIQRRASQILRKHGSSKKGISLKIILNPAILEQLKTEDEELLIDLQNKLNGDLIFRTDANMHIQEFAIFDMDSEKELYNSATHS
ncbi:MAG: Rne/Rng family ribonuclease [Lentisphaerae bacterium]|nr:Rne/Rng family ribonuclease [Lentisphaerota bacterium]